MPLSTNFFSFMVFMCYVLYNFLQKKKWHSIYMTTLKTSK
jgi:hypothetical protein